MRKGIESRKGVRVGGKAQKKNFAPWRPFHAPSRACLATAEFGRSDTVLAHRVRFESTVTGGDRAYERMPLTGCPALGPDRGGRRRCGTDRRTTARRTRRGSCARGGFPSCRSRVHLAKRCRVTRPRPAQADGGPAAGHHRCASRRPVAWRSPGCGPGRRGPLTAPRDPGWAVPLSSRPTRPESGGPPSDKADDCGPSGQRSSRR